MHEEPYDTHDDDAAGFASDTTGWKPGRDARAFLDRLSRQTGTAIGRLVAFSRYADPFLAGTPDQVRKAEWFARITKLHGIISGHARSIFYRLVRAGEIGTDPEKAREDWERLQDAMGFARTLGLVDPYAFTERRTVVTVQDGRRGSTAISYAKPSLDLPEPPSLNEGVVLGFNSLAHQPVRLLVATEKEDADLEAETVPPCERFGAEMIVTKGNSTRGRAYEIAKVAREDPLKRPVRVFWLSDADSSGEDMPGIMARHLEYIVSQDPDVPPIQLDALALTLEQVEEIEAEIGEPIPRAPDVRREIGRVELDAVLAYAPGWVERKLTEALKEATVRITRPEVEIPEDVQTVLDQAQAEAESLYAEIGERLEEIRERVEEALEGWEPEPPEVAVPEPKPSEREWLLDTERGYFEQLAFYRRRREDMPELEQRVCQGCGGPIPEHRAVQARYCTDDCAQRARTRRRRSR